MKTNLVYYDWAGYWHGVTSSGKQLQVYEAAMRKHVTMQGDSLPQNLPEHLLDPDFWEYFIDKDDAVRDVTNTTSYDGSWIYAQILERGSDATFKKGLYRLYALWGYETQGGRQSPFWQDPATFMSPAGAESFRAWRATKRPFTKEEVTKGKWEKHGDETGVYFDKQELRLFPDGTLREHDLGKLYCTLESVMNFW